MEVINASGRKVSLLNDTPPSTYFSYPRPNSHSRKSSYSTQMSRDDSDSPQNSRLASPTFSPKSAPQLVRFNSSSSQGTLQTPSPMTPNYAFEPLEQTKTVSPREPYYRPNAPYYAPMPHAHEFVSQPYYNLPLRQNGDLAMDEMYASLEPSIQTQSSYANIDIPTPASPQSILQTSNTAIPRAAQVAPSENLTNSNKLPTKKKYPCPHAKAYSCTDTFTTSGHAARHGKKHTGEKNILCPTCNKAFTRKDNMKQHERTHKSGQDSSSVVRTSTNNPSSMLIQSTREAHSASRKRIKTARSRPTTGEPMSVASLEDDDDLDPEADESEYGTIRASRPQMRRSVLSESLHYSDLSIDTSLAEGSRPSFDRRISGGSQDGEGESPGLDALAMAASEMSA
ncbi:hypothetical protein MMC14_003662 [Varicellaria rhodocarpa]|nr:hypothetical protein [Varicellaria rhodocarpa]